MGREMGSPVHPLWKNDLYRMQLAAPVPIPIISKDPPMSVPEYMGRDFHGKITHLTANHLLCHQPNGAYLVRNTRSANGQFHALSLKFNDKVHHYRLYYDHAAGLFHVREKKYECVKALVADGLVNMYLEAKEPNIVQRLAMANYQESPYMTLNKRKLRALSNHFTNKPYSIHDILPSSSDNHKIEKQHHFKLTTFKGLNWCELCGNFLWGFTFQGKKCEDCGIIAHVHCSEKFPNDCVPDLKHIRGVFGIDLTTLLTAHGTRLPFVVTKCVCEVEARGLTSEGIYRLSGFAEEIEAIKLALDRDGESADLSHNKWSNINAITGALKSYLRLLPIPLITFIVHPMLVEALQIKNVDTQRMAVQQALSMLPKAHYHTLKFMMEHLKRVSQHAAINKMTPHNLATVFAPTLIASQENTSMDLLPDMTSDILVIELLITKYDDLFTDCTRL